MMPLPIVLTVLILVLGPIFSGVPDESLWSQGLEALILCGVALTLFQRVRRESSHNIDRILDRILILFVALGALSLIVRWAGQHGGPAYLDIMLRASTYFSACAALYYIARCAASSSLRDRSILLASLLAGATIVSGIGVQEYLVHVRIGQPQWRVFSQSTPDFLAGYLVVVAPVTLGLLLSSPRSFAVSMGLGLCLVLELGTILTTGSRFALASLALSLVVFVATALYSRPAGNDMTGKGAAKLIAGSVVGIVALSFLAKPVLIRLAHPDQNSAEFRLWTWRGTLRLIEAHSLFGSGIGTYRDAYPLYALTGFARLAHNSYLQYGADCGIPGLVVLIALLVLPIFVGLYQIKGDKLDTSDSQAWNQRLIHCGLISGVVAGVAQNLIDSDLYVFPCGCALFAVAGLCAGMKNETNKPDGKGGRTVARAKSFFVIALSMAAISMSALSVLNAIGAWHYLRGKVLSASQSTVSDSEMEYRAAMQISPLNGLYRSDFGYQVLYEEENNPAESEKALRKSILLEPNEVSYRRLGDVLAFEGKIDEAKAATNAGLMIAPSSLDLLMNGAKFSSPSERLIWYRKISDLEMTPVGTARALAQTEERFGIADAFLEDASYRSGDYTAAIRYGRRAIGDLQAYFAEGGSASAMRLAMSGGQPDSEKDAALEAILSKAQSQLTVSLTAQNQSGIAAK